MDNLERLFISVSKARTLKELDSIIEDDKDVKMIVGDFEEKYPAFNLSIKKEEIADLVEKKVITESHTIELEGGYNFSSFEKLLLAVLWKNGHITRVQPILDGIMGDRKSVSEFGVIFRQFGRSLADPDEPIVDQHVLRAFCTYYDLGEVKGRKVVPRKGVFKESDQAIIDAYRQWFKEIVAEVTFEKEKFKYRLDKILFAIGKLTT